MLVILVDVYWYFICDFNLHFFSDESQCILYFLKNHTQEPKILTVAICRGVMTYCFVIVCFLFCGLGLSFAKLFCFFIKHIFNLKNLHLLVLINSKVYQPQH